MPIDHLKKIKPYTLLTILAIFAPALTIASMIRSYGVNVPFTDQYDGMIPMFKSIDMGHIPLGLLWAQHNEHRLFFPNSILLILDRITHWDTKLEMYTSFIVACIGFYGLYILMTRRIKKSSLRLVAVFLSACVFFSPVQWQNWLWGWQLEWFMCVAAIIWTVVLADGLPKNPNNKKFFLPGVIAFVATFSLASGFLAWIAALIVMLARRFKIKQIGAWVVAAALSIGLYYFHYTEPNDSFFNGGFLGHTDNLMRFYMGYVGRPISADSNQAELVGVYILVIYLATLIYIVFKKKVSEMSALIALGLAAMAAGVPMILSRYNLGIINALSSRYTSFSEIILISLIIMLIYLVSLKTGRADSYGMKYVKPIIITLLVLPALVLSWKNGINGMKTQHAQEIYMYQCSHVPNPTQKCLYAIYFPSTTVAKSDLDYLKKKGYGGY
jgi:hypothetical protein